MNKPGTHTSGFLAGLLIGAIAGIIAGILLAPDKGSETRRKIITKTNEFSDDLPDRLEELKSAIERKINEIKASRK